MDRLVIHLHMPKTAGTTVERIFTHRLPKESVLNHFHRPQQLEALAQWTPAEKARIRYVRGHFGFGLHECFPQPSTYITFLRHPLERILSEFYFVKTRDKARAGRIPVFAGLEEMWQNPDCRIDDFVHHLDHHPGFANAQTRWLSGLFGIVERAPYAPVSPAALETAKRNLEAHFTVVGITEAFDDGFCLLAQRFNFSMRELMYETRRVNEGRPKWRDLSSNTRTLLEKHNELDLELYEFACRLMTKRFNSLGLRWRITRRFVPVARWIVDTARESAQLEWVRRSIRTTTHPVIEKR